jgi:hypothetical protein
MPLWIRQPTANPVAVMKAIGSTARIRLATAWPARNVARGIGREWKRSIAPFVRS